MYLNIFLDFLTSLPGSMIYLFLVLSAFVENVFPPFPGDMTTAFGAFLIGTGRLGFLGVYLSTTLGSLSGFMFLFWLGRLLGRHFFIERDFSFLKAKNIIQAEIWFQRYGYFFILFNRFFPGIRSVISIAAGISKLKTLKVALLAFISSCVWNLIWIFLGYMLGTNWEIVKNRILHIMGSYSFIILGLLIIIIVIYTVKRLTRKGGQEGI